MGPTDELWERGRRLEAERLRPERPAARVSGPVADLRRLIAVLARLLKDPGPPDPPSTPVEPPVDKSNK
jgi:hypothetical protein